MPSVQVVAHENGWKIIDDGDETGEIYETQERAVEAARSRARDKGVEVEIRSDEGTVDDVSSYGSDPNNASG